MVLKEMERLNEINRKIRHYGLLLERKNDIGLRVRGEIRRSYVFLVAEKENIKMKKWEPKQELSESERKTLEWERDTVNRALKEIKEIAPEWVE